MRAEEQFDSFYLKTRRALVHQTFALTGDLPAAQRAVRDAFVAAWHHWRKVGAYDEPISWVRPRAWAQAQRRHTARIWHRNRSLTHRERTVLDALHRLTGAERRSLLLVELAGVDREAAARELGMSRETLDREHAAAVAKLAVQLRTDPAEARSVLEELRATSARATLLRPHAVRREGTARRRWHTAVAAAAVVFVAVGSGAFAHDPAPQPEAVTAAPSPAPSAGSPAASPSGTASPRPSPTPEPRLPSAEDLLTPQSVRLLDPGRRWRTRTTHDNTSGRGINFVCQQQRFADPEGLGTLVRRLSPRGSSPRQVVQVVEISRSDDAAADTYERLQTWFAGCPDGRVHLRGTFRVSGVADRAMILRFQEWGRVTTHSVGLALVDQVVTTTVVRTSGAEPPPLNSVAAVLRNSTRPLCARTGDDACTDRMQVAPSLPPEPRDPTGMLTPVDMPSMPGIRRPWVATDPAPLRGNPAATSCDRAGFRPAGARRARMRTFLVPEAPLPARFGLTEVTGEFPGAGSATRFLDEVRQSVAGCEDRDLATEVVESRSFERGRVTGSSWLLRTELSETREVVYRVGFVRRGAHVAQVTFVPGGRGDLSGADFHAVLLRAGQRLAERG